MTVYIEYVILDNFVIDWILLKATLYLTGRTVKKGRLFICSFFGAIFALLTPLIYYNLILSFLIKVLCAITILLLLRRYKSLKDLYKTFVVFFGLSVFAGGCVYALFSIFNLRANSEFSIAFMIIPVYISIKFCISLFNYLKASKLERNYFVSCTIKKGQLTFDCKGFFDTGNGVYYKHSPVVFIDQVLAKKLITNSDKIFDVNIQTINGSSTKKGFLVDEIKIYLSSGVNTYNNVVVAVANFKGQEYSLILHPALKEIENVC